MPTTLVYLFGSHFGSRDKANAFCDRDWGNAPDDEDSEEVWKAWEENFPKWPLKDELGIVYLDEDYVEIHFGPEVPTRFDESIEIDGPLAQSIAARYDTPVVLGHESLGGFEVELKSSPRFEYLGAFNQNW